MTGKMTKGSVTISMAIGTLLVPLSAVAAIWLTGSDDSGQESVESTSTTTLATTSSSAEPVKLGVTPADLLTACGPEGAQLVALEKKGEITDVQQAALDALRDVCEEVGLALPDRPTPDPLVETVVIPAATTATTIASAVASDDSYADDDYDDDQYEDDEYEDDEYEDDEYEDEDHEDSYYEDEDHHGGEVEEDD